jgi:lysyl-tRNA synthetase class 1
MDEFAAFAAKTDRDEGEEQLLQIATRGIDKPTVSRVPFSLLVASYQAALKDTSQTLKILSRTEYAELAMQDAEIIEVELKFIDAWLQKRAPEDVKFELTQSVNPEKFNDRQKAYMNKLADKIESAHETADGTWFHQAIYELKDSSQLETKELFITLYQAIIGKESGPRAGWFLSILPRDWLIKRLRLDA